MKKLLIIPIAITHFLLCFALALMILSTGLDRPRIDLKTAELLDDVLHILMLPVVAFMGTLERSASLHVPRMDFPLWALNSLLWGTALYYGGGWLYRRWRGRKRPVA